MLQSSHRDDDHNGLRPITVVAVRHSDRPGWRLIPLECELDLLPHLLTKFGLDSVEFRLVGNGRTGRGLEERFAVRSALSGSWDWDKEADGWFPLDEPLPSLLPGEAVATAVVLSLKSVLSGCIEIVVEAGGKSLTMWLDDVHDSPVSLVRFIQILEAGGQPHASLADGSGRFVVQNSPNPNQYRFYVEGQIDRDEFTKASFDILTERAKLVQQFRKLARSIADHPAFPHLFVCHACLPHDEYDRVGDAAELEWKEGVKSGQLPDDFDAEEQFVAARIVAEVPLPEDCAREANEQQEMLRSLQIPIRWLVSHGLVQWTPS